ncbi:MAG: LexA family transcriptional regulator [Clostridiales bacterium]|nr:LexA family transcriptional regulator [Clostridiales bacterium]
MIGKIIRKRRKEIDMTLTELSKLTKIDVGHLSHIENGERNPSYKTLKLICDAIGVPVTHLWNYTGKTIKEERENYEYMNYINFNKIPLVEVKDFVTVPANYDGNVIAVTLNDDSMNKLGDKGEFVYVDLNAPVKDGDIIVAKYNNEILVRKYKLNGYKIKLSAYNKEYSDIKVAEEDELEIIGKVIENKKK